MRPERVPTDIDPRAPTPPVRSSRDRPPRPNAAFVAPAAFGLLWVALARHAPTTTWHIAPALVAASGPVYERITRRQPVPVRRALVVTVEGLVVAFSVTVILTVEGWLRGPTIVHHGSATIEALAVASFAAAWGMRVATRTKTSRWVGALSALDE